MLGGMRSGWIHKIRLLMTVEMGELAVALELDKP